jgi:hypothetical protein
MRLFRAKPEVKFKRKCSECGHSWHVTAKEREMGAPNNLQINGLIHSVGTRVQMGNGYRRPTIAREQLARFEAQRPRHEAQRSRVEDLNTCRSCGSVTFTERQV